MRDLTYQQLLKAPTEVQYIYVSGLNDRMIGHSFFEEAMAKYPEYFQEEIEYRMKWKLVPEEVRNNYNKALDDLNQELLPNYGKNWRYYLEHQEECAEQYNSVKDEIERRKKEIWNNFYGPFGLKRE